jgi:8-oxo-dGTP diphosphatase
MEAHKLAVYVCLLLEKDNKVLLLKRANTGWMDGYWHVPGGTLEENESLAHAVTREGKEELAVTVDPKHVKLIAIKHFNKSRFGFYFLAHEWQGEPINNEPDQCSEVGWFDINKLPENISPFARSVVERSRNEVHYTYFE